MDTALLPSVYLGPIQYFSKLKRYNTCLVDYFEHLPKQTFRNRAEVYSPNGKLALSVPLVKRNQRQQMKDVKIAYEVDWQKLHWRSLESCYRRSPFFEFYEDRFRPFYEHKKPVFLVDLNNELQDLIVQLLKLETTCQRTDHYVAAPADAVDFRSLISPKSNWKEDTEFHVLPYWQVFQTRHDFLPNLSIVDLLFNQGPRAVDFL